MPPSAVKRLPAQAGEAAVAEDSAAPSSPCAAVACTVQLKPGPQRAEQLVAVVRSLVPGTDPDLPATVTVVSGGTTNALFKVCIGDIKVLVRVFGSGSDLLIDRARDNKVAEEVSAAGLGPRYYGSFSNGRVEGWIDAEPITPPQRMGQPEFQALIAQKLARVHALDISIAHCGSSGESVLWQQLGSWLGQFKALVHSEPGKAKLLRGIDLAWIEAAVQKLKGELAAVSSGAATADAGPSEAASSVMTSQVVCHNDVNSGNVLVAAEDPDAVHFIDWEYAGLNPAGFDIGNHWCEYAGFDFRGSLHEYPSPDLAKAFMQHYVEARCPAIVQSDWTAEEQAQFWAACTRMGNMYALASHLLWGVWSIMQAAFSEVEFDFIDYAAQRFDAFKLQREHFDLPPVMGVPGAGAAADAPGAGK